MCRLFDSDLPTSLPSLWRLLTPPSSSSTSEKDLLQACLLIELILPSLPSSSPLLPQLLQSPLIPLISSPSPSPSLRHILARALASFSKTSLPLLLTTLLPTTFLPALTTTTESSSTSSTTKQRIVLESLYLILRSSSVSCPLSLLPFLPLLVLPILGFMTDFDPSLRRCASLSFSTLIQHLPLLSQEDSLRPPPNLSLALQSTWKDNLTSLSDLLRPARLAPKPLSFTLADPSIRLRPYQMEGINWLLFLNRVKLHGILCDDMGLGKTLQTLCLLAEVVVGVASQGDSRPSLGPSLVVCPATLTQHWSDEIHRYISPGFLEPLLYRGSPSERQVLQETIKDNRSSSRMMVVLSAYETVRSDVGFFATQSWFYLVLDEGHVIKNARSKLSQAIKRLGAQHRLILSGTPVQNDVLELWSLFDFLMPGFLGTEKYFNANFSKPIFQVRRCTLETLVLFREVGLVS